MGYTAESMRRSAPLVLIVAALGCAPPSRQPSFATVTPQAPTTTSEITPLEAPSLAHPPEQTPEQPRVEAPTNVLPESGSDPTYAGLEEEDEHEEEEDEHDEHDEHDAGSTASLRAAPKITLTDEQIAQKAKQEPASLGSLSMGTPNAGYQINSVMMPQHEHWKIIGAPNAWGTQETVDFIAHAIHAVNKKFPNTSPIFIGHISAKHGGYLSPHKSHQAGRDVDIGYYYNRDTNWFERATSQNLDVPRTWALLKTFVDDTDVEMIFIDTPIQSILSRYAESIGEDAAYLDRIFQVRGKSLAPIVRYAKGHATHLHVRFHSPMAQELGRRAQRYFHRPAAALAKAPRGKSAPGQKEVVGTSRYVMHKARSGDVLVNLAKHYGTTPEAIIQANNIRGNSLKIGQMYRIPVPAKSAPVEKTPSKKGTLHAKRSRG